MIFFPDRIFQTRVGLSFFDSFEKASELALSYRVGRMDMGNGTIVLQTPYSMGWLWYKEVVLTIRLVAANISRVSMIGKPALSPHHLFRAPYFIAGRVARDQLLRDAEWVFRGYLLHDRLIITTVDGDPDSGGP